MAIFTATQRRTLYEAAKFTSTEKPGEAKLTIALTNGKYIDQDFPTLEKAEASLKQQIKKDLAKKLIARARIYVYDQGWYNYKPDKEGAWEKNPPQGAITVFKVWSENK